ncbi:MAG: flagellar motor switch protein FliN [Firmicutes bacterium]|nr:flagellar motor switch protein FliN [Bacillota bacterium]
MHEHLLSRQELEALLKPDPAAEAGSEQARKLKVVLDFPLELSVRLGNATRTIAELSELAAGAVIELDREIGQPADLIVNGEVAARGEIVVIGENFGVRITSIVRPIERIEQLRQEGSS